MNLLTSLILCISFLFQYSCSESSDNQSKDVSSDQKADNAKDDSKSEKLPEWIKKDAKLYAGIANVDLIDFEFETHIEETGNSVFNGCYDSPEKTNKCKEGFKDLNGNGKLEPVFIAGFGNERLAAEIHDPVKATALYVGKDTDYLIFVGLDIVGLMFNRIQEIQNLLAENGFDPAKVIIASSHNHQGPDTVGYWGNPFAKVSGVNPKLQDGIAAKVLAAVKKAVESRKEAKVKFAAKSLSEESPYFNGEKFGGTNPKSHIKGLINDSRDPTVIDDQLLAISFYDKESNRFANLINFSSHPELIGGSNTKLSSDYVHYLRKWNEDAGFGDTIFLPSCLGGMMSGLGAPVPEVDDAGEFVFEKCSDKDLSDGVKGCKKTGDIKLDESGVKLPVWIKKASFEAARSYGYILAKTAARMLDKAAFRDVDKISSKSLDVNIPLTNSVFEYLLSIKVLDPTIKQIEAAGKTCDRGDTILCIPSMITKLEFGPWKSITAPGEVLPELFWGMPESDEFKEFGKRGKDSTYFPQHDSKCDEFTFEECSSRFKVDNKDGEECNCGKTHAAPYTVSKNESLKPIVYYMGDAEIKSLIGAGQDFYGYIIPSSDIHTKVSAVTGDGGSDHYEETVMTSSFLGDLFLEKAAELLSED